MAVLSSALIQSGVAALFRRGFRAGHQPRLVPDRAEQRVQRDSGWAAFTRGDAIDQVPDGLSWSERKAWQQGWEDARNWTRDIS